MSILYCEIIAPGARNPPGDVDTLPIRSAIATLPAGVPSGDPDMVQDDVAGAAPAQFCETADTGS
jgi:hypothetical protein